MNILIINGPNINMLGIREPIIYGNSNYQELEKYIKELSEKYQFKYKMIQTNSESTIIDYIQNAYYQKANGIVINAGAYSHYSYAIYDALMAVKIPTVEVHLSNIFNREPFRQNSVIRDACLSCYCGEHFESYHKAILHLIEGNN